MNRDEGDFQLSHVYDPIFSIGSRADWPVMRREILKMAAVVVETANQCKILLCCVKMNFVNIYGFQHDEHIQGDPVEQAE